MKRWKTLLVPSLVLAMAGGQLLAQEDGEQKQRRRSRLNPLRGRLHDRMREMMMSDDGAPKVGDPAPVFKLKSLDGKRETDLASFKGKRPVILFFGSYT